MSGILLFCTAQMLARVINRLLTDCTLPQEASNIFSLVRDPSQENSDESHSSPPISDFITGFEGASDAELRRYTRQSIAETSRRHAVNLTGWWMAILDERSPTENTVVTHYHMGKSLWEDLLRETEQEVRIPGWADVNEAEDSIWWKWRVPFKSTFNIWNNIESLGWEALGLYSQEEYVGEDGVVQAHIPDQIVHGDKADPKGVI